MDTKRKLIAGGTLALGLVAGGATIAVAGGATDSDAPLTGSDLDRASTAALAEVGQGTVVETEVGDDGAAYGVEIRLDDGPCRRGEPRPASSSVAGSETR